MRFKRHRKKTDPLLAEKKPFFSPNRKVQTKEDQITNKKGNKASADKSEKQADEYADNVVQGSEIKKADQSTIAKASEDEEKSASKTQAQKKEEEETATKSEIHKQEEDETATKLKVQRQEEDETATKSEIQRQEEDETAAKLEIQKQEESSSAKASEDKDETASKSEIQKQEEDETAAKSETLPFESRVKDAKTGGVPLTDKVRQEMEKKLKSEFGRVRIHTDDMAIELCREIHAQAFTNGYHIFFNKGKYNPDSYSGKHLLAHELTHVMQQKGK